MEMDLTERLPEDVLADVLRRLAPRWLAASRSVCRAWRAAVDSHGLLRAVAGLLPRSLAGIYIYNSDAWVTLFLCRPSTGPTVSADLDYAFSDDGGGGAGRFTDGLEVRDHCNGLILVEDRVVNPATRQCARLPPRPPPPCAGPEYFYADEYLAYDPTVSPHYEVFSIPRVRRKHELGPRYAGDQIPSCERLPFTYKKLDPALEELEWPPSPCDLHVFSSRTGRWEKRSFVREGAAAGTIAQMRTDPFIGHRYAAYWRGALYVQCQTDFIMRLSLSSEKYQIIQPPVSFEPQGSSFNEQYERRLSIGKSKNGVYSVLVDHNQIKVWILDDSNGQIKWMSKQLGGHPNELQDKSYYVLESHGSWMLQSISSSYDADDPEFEEVVPKQFEWDSDDDDLLPENGNRTGYKSFISFMGFHPYKEIIFLSDSCVRALAYHLDSSKIQDLGYAYPEYELLEMTHEFACVKTAFPYTPCWIRDFPQND